MKARVDQYIAVPCCGDEANNIEKDHIYLIKSPIREGKKELGWMTLGEAKERYGSDKIFISASHGMCKECLELKFGKSKNEIKRY